MKNSQWLFWQTAPNISVPESGNKVYLLDFSQFFLPNFSNCKGINDKQLFLLLCNVVKNKNKNIKP